MHRSRLLIIVLSSFLTACGSDDSNSSSDPLHVRVAQGELEGVIGEDPSWPLFDAARGNRLNLDAAPSVVDEFRKERCDWWKGYYDSLFE